MNVHYAGKALSYSRPVRHGDLGAKTPIIKGVYVNKKGENIFR
jgi:hypothetical protein